MVTMTPQPAQPEMVKTKNARPIWRKHLFKLILLPLGAAIAIWFLIIMPRTSKTVDDAFPTAAPAKAAPAVIQPTSPPAATGPLAIKSGTFIAVEHDGSGKATVFKQADGTYILRFDDLNVANGPDLRVRLLGPNGISLDIGALKGNKGNQNYELPIGFDPAKYDTADVWCRAFKVTFNKAALT